MKHADKFVIVAAIALFTALALSLLGTVGARYRAAAAPSQPAAATTGR